MSNTNQDASLITGHANLAKGAAYETIGNMTGSADWKSSGADIKQSGIDEMKAASEARDKDSQQHGLGAVEKAAGSMVGCEGMEKEGEQSKKQ